MESLVERVQMVWYSDRVGIVVNVSRACKVGCDLCVVLIESYIDDDLF